MKIKKIYIDCSKLKIAPFQSDVGGCLMLNKTITEHYIEIAKKLKLDILESEDVADGEYYLYVCTDTYASEPLLKNFIEKATGACRLDFNASLLKKFANEWIEKITKTSTVYNVAIKTKKQRVRDLPVLSLDANEKTIRAVKRHWALDVGIADELPIVEFHLYKIRHWRDWWFANWVLLGHETNRLRNIQNLKDVTLGQNTHIIKSVIGKNVTIGSNVIIENSVIGDDVSIGTGSIIKDSSVGGKSMIGEHSFLKACILCENVAIGIGDKFQSSIFGKEVFVAASVNIADLCVKRNVKVMYNNSAVDSGLGFLGAAVGDNSFIGLDVSIGPGTEIPSKTVIVRKDVINNKNIKQMIKSYNIYNISSYGLEKKYDK